MKQFILLAAACVGLCAGISAQNVGIGTTTPAFRFDVVGSINTDSFYRIGGYPVLSTKGTANSFVGTNAGFSNSTGHSNTATGFQSLYNNTTGFYNSGFGREALFSNTGGTYNSVVGYQSAYQNTGGYELNGLGYQTLFSNTTGHSNSAVGAYTLYNNTTGNYNIALGGSSMYYNVNGSFNTAAGYAALLHNTSGLYNVAMGYTALEPNTTGSGNTAVGYLSLNLTSSSSYNTVLGYKAGHGFGHGWNNTFIGAESNAQGTGFFNCVAIGNLSVATASNQARIGNSSTNSIGGFANWSNISDGRYKKNIKEDVRGLDFIMKLRPVTYHLDVTGLNEKLTGSANRLVNTDVQKALIEKEQTIQTGFIAQEVEAAAKELHYDFSGVDKPKNTNDLYGLRYAEFVVPLVKAVQEQQAIIKQLQAQIDELKKIISSSNKQ